MTERKAKWQGQKWCRNEKRLAIYLRDGLACIYCGLGVEDGVKFTLDHIQPYSYGGSNHESNLITACHTCNSSRGNRSVQDFSTGVAMYRNHGLTAQQILDHIADRTSQNLKPYKNEAKKMLARRNFSACVYN